MRERERERRKERAEAGERERERGGRESGSGRSARAALYAESRIGDPARGHARAYACAQRIKKSKKLITMHVICIGRSRRGCAGARRSSGQRRVAPSCCRQISAAQSRHARVHGVIARGRRGEERHARSRFYARRGATCSVTCADIFREKLRKKIEDRKLVVEGVLLRHRP